MVSLENQNLEIGRVLEMGHAWVVLDLEPGRFGILLLHGWNRMVHHVNPHEKIHLAGKTS